MHSLLGVGMGSVRGSYFVTRSGMEQKNSKPLALLEKELPLTLVAIH